MMPQSSVTEPVKLNVHLFIVGESLSAKPVSMQ